VTLQDSIRRVWTVIALHTAPGTPQFIKGWAALIPHGRGRDFESPPLHVL